MSCCSITQSGLILYNSIDGSTPGFPVLPYLPEFAQIHVHCFDDAIQLSHPLSPPSPLALSIFQHQGLLQWIRSSHSGGQTTGVSALASVLPRNIQGWWLTGLISLLSKGLSRVFSSTIVQNHEFLAFSLLYGPTLKLIPRIFFQSRFHFINWIQPSKKISLRTNKWFLRMISLKKELRTKFLYYINISLGLSL